MEEFILIGFVNTQKGKKMSDCMTFPNTVEEFMEMYKVVDTQGIYMSKNSKLVPIFRMEQWFEHNQWQLTSNKLPKNGIDYLLTVKDRHKYNVIKIGHRVEDFYKIEGHYVPSNNIIAWMPLPKPYEKG